MLRDVSDIDAETFAFGHGAERAATTAVDVQAGPSGATATIADAHLMFNSDFVRAGNDLILRGHDGGSAFVRDYFASDERATLVSRDGARLSGELIDAMAGSLAPGQYAQAGQPAPAPAASDAVGRVVTASGDASIIRNGVAVTLKQGDPVLRADVLQTHAGTMAVTFNDGSTLNLTANTRIVVSEFVYSPNGAGNSQLLNLVQGSLTFISGEVAHSGNMRIGTPVATMGIRGTVGGVTTANDGTVHFYVSQSATGAVIINEQGQIIANVVQDGPMIVVRPAGPLQVVAEEVQKSPAQLAQELAALQQIVSIKAVGDQLLQQFFQQQNPNNPNPQTPQDRPHTQIQIDLHHTANEPNDGNPPGGNPGPIDQATVHLIPTNPDNPAIPPTITDLLQTNLPPVTFAPLVAAVKEDETLTFSGAKAVSVFDADTTVLTVSLTVTHGLLNLAGVAGLSFAAGTGANAATMTFSGTQAAINAALDGMTFTPSADYNGAAALTITTQDDGSHGITTSVPIVVTAVNDAPVIVGSVAVDLPLIEGAGPGGGLEPEAGLNAQIAGDSAVQAALSGLLTVPAGVITVALATVRSELHIDTATAMTVVWDYLDDIYVSAGPHQANVNEAFTRLGIEYAKYLKDGGAPLTNVTAKYTPDGNSNGTPDRVQSLHDNLLGNLGSAALLQRYGGSPTLLAELTALINGVDPALLTRPYYSGNEGSSPAAVQAWDSAHGYAPSVFIENGGPAVVNARITLSDVDSATLSGATVKIAGNFASGEDVLSFTTQGGITGTYDAQTGVLTLSGTASLADYQAVLRSATYENTSESPSGLPRTIEFQVNDGAAEHAASNVVAVTVNVTPVNDAPVLDYFNLTIAEGGTTVLSTSDFHITDPDSSNFFFSFQNNVTGGQFEVLTDGNWVSAPTGGFTAADIAAGHVRFVHDGGETAPTFTVWVSDFSDAGPAISPTVNFTNVVADGTVDPSATKASSGHPNEIINGSGIPASHFGLVKQTDVGVELGLQVIYRQGPTVTTTDNYNDGILRFAVASGAQSTANGSSSDNAGRAAWSFDYSIATGLNSHTTTDLSDFTFKLMVDVDSSAATNYHTFEMVAVPQGINATGFAWVDDSVNATGINTINGHPIVIGDDAGNTNVAQNSENYAFGFIHDYLTGSYASGFGGPGQFDIILEAFSQNGTVLATNHIQVDVNDVTYVADGTVDPSATKASSGHPNEIINGSGIPASHFGLVKQADVGVELGLQVIYRHGPAVTTTDNYNDGILKFAVASGAESTANGSQINVANRAAWNFDYSIATGLNGHTTTDLSDFTFKLMVDVDSSAATDYHTFEMMPTGTGATGFAWVDDSVNATGINTINGHPIVIGDDAGNPSVAQNSENYAFGFIQNYLTGAYASGFGGPGQFDLILEASSHDGTILATNHIQVDVNAAPVASGDSNTTTEDLVTVATGNVLSNDSDADNNTLSVSASSQGLHHGLYGDLQLNANGSYTYTLGVSVVQAAAVQGLSTADTAHDIFAYTANDGLNASNSANLDIAIHGSNDAPVIVGSVAADLPLIEGAGPGGGLEPDAALNAQIAGDSAVQAALSGLLTVPAGVITVALATVRAELHIDTATAMTVVWDYLDDIYVSAGPHQTNVNEAFTRLGIEYAKYLKDGGAPLTNITAKYTPDGADAGTAPDRVQSLHDNLLGNLGSAALNQRYGGNPALLAELTALINAVDPALLTRPYYSGNETASPAAVQAWDAAHGYTPAATGMLVATDVDHGATLTWSVNHTAGTYGTFALDAVSGVWTYKLDNSLPATQALAQGETATETFTATVTDEHGATDTIGVTVTVGTSDDNTLNLSATDWSASTAIDLGGGTNVVNVLANGADISASGVPMVDHVDTGNLVGTGGDDSITLTGLQLDHIIVGNGTIDLGAGTHDTINLTSTSADLNALGATDASIAGVEAVSASTATAGVTIDLHGQSEAFAITGSSFADTLSGGSGADTISGGDGNDTITGGAGADHLMGGLGVDAFIIASPGDLAGDVIDGTAQDKANITDVIKLTTGSTYDLSNANGIATVSNIDNIALTNAAGGYSVIVGDNLVSSAHYNGASTGYLHFGSGGSTVTGSVSIDASGLTGTNHVFVNGSGFTGTNTYAGGQGNDLFSSGGTDTFVFHNNFGNDTVQSFTAGDATGHDILQFDSDVFASAADVLSHASGSTNTVITDTSGHTVTLNGVDHTTLTTANIQIYDVINHVLIA